MTESTPAEWRNGTEAVEVSSGGIDVDVRRRLADGGVPAFEYVIASTRSATVDLMLTQTLPDAVDPDDVGFPADGQRRWTVRDETWMTYERRLQPGATIRTAWGVRLDAHPSVDPPEVHVVVADRASALEGSGGASLGDQSGAAAGVRAADAAAASEDDRGKSGPTVAESREQPRASGDSPSPGSDSTPTSGRDSSPTPGSGTPPTSGSDPSSAPEAEAPACDSLTTALVQELRAGDVAEAERRELRRALGVDGHASPDAVVEQVRALERHHEQLTEAVETLEDRLADVRGAAPTTTELNRLKRGLATLYDATVAEEELETLRERVADVEDLDVEAEAIRDLRGALAQVDQDAADQAELDELRASVDALEESTATAAELEAVRETIDAVDDQLTSLESTAEEVDLGDLSRTVETVADVRAELEDAVAAIESLESTVTELEATAVGDDAVEEVERVEERVAELAERAASADALREVNERLAQVEQGVLGYRTLSERVDELESRTERRLESHERTLAELRAAREATGCVRQHVNETRSDLARLEDRLDDEFASEAELETSVDRQVRTSVFGYGLLAAGGVGLVATLPLATATTPVAAASAAAGTGALVLRWLLRSHGT